MQKTISLHVRSHLATGAFPLGFAPQRAIHPEYAWRRRWEDNLSCIPKHMISKNIRACMRAIVTLGNSVPPRVTNAVIRLGYHSWPTRSRCGVLRHKCLLCGSQQDDKLNHIIRCGVVRRTFARYLICASHDYSPEVFLLCHDRHSRNRDNAQMSAILIAAFYKLLNKLRHGMRLATCFDSQFDKFVDDAVYRHSSTCYALIRNRRFGI